MHDVIAALGYFVLLGAGLFGGVFVIIWLESDAGPAKPELRNRRKR